ncbi:hypothetical protein EAI_00806 [Harpegnathos saltator]|uniref:Serine palmitoyltransferase small subunit A n=1 Tax=Harpegnathos saltator TaxID=610380 RepID=E2BXF5_HARSA|nr:hypothetical protein EAI_00806 [Harpegnathos saltator]
MINLVQRLQSFLKYWYFRFMLVTELYMVERWERNFINIFFLVVFSLFFVFNYKILLPFTQYMLQH